MNIKEHLMKYVLSGAIIVGILICVIIFFFFQRFTLPQNKLPFGGSISITPILPGGRSYGAMNIPFLSTVNEQTTTNQAIPLNQTNSIQVNNFASTATETTDGLLLLVEVPQSYTITYASSTAKFQINVTGADFNSLRKTAEQNLLNMLGVSPKQACKLNIGIDVAYSINLTGTPYNAHRV